MQYSENPDVRVFLAGVGGVGEALLSQLSTRNAPARSGEPAEIRLEGVATSRWMRIGGDDGNPEALVPAPRSELEKGASALSLEHWSQRVERCPGHPIVVDATASTAIPALYERFLASGASVVTANKLGLTGPMASFTRLVSGRFYYETTAGAGLPVIETLRALIATGDRLERLEGVFSGTLAFLFHQLRQGVRFDEAVEIAREKGYTEPDPREDLSGKDVARKLLILARTAGFHLELDDIEVESLVDRGERVEQMSAAAREEGRSLCYLATFHDGRARVRLQTVERDHPAATVSGTDNIFSFTTERYRDSPLVVRGSGAGPAVTAAGVFADILRACREHA